MFYGLKEPRKSGSIKVAPFIAIYLFSHEKVNKYIEGLGKFECITLDFDFNTRSKLILKTSLLKR